MFALNNMAWGIPSIIPPINLKKVAETDGAAVLKLMRKHGISTTTSSPPFYDRLADFHEAHPDVPAHNLRRILVGGAPVSQAQLRRWGKVWPNTFIVVGYGSSECEPVAHIAAMERLWNKSKLRPEAPGICLGKIVPGVEASDAVGGDLGTELVRMHASHTAQRRSLGGLARRAPSRCSATHAPSERKPLL